MQAHAECGGYSAAIKLELRVNGKSFELASVGPTKIILREAVELPACNAEVAVFVDNHLSVWPVRIPNGAVPFDTAVKTQSRGEMRRSIMTR